jgi:tRNA A37 threonylcarbamoyladenosine synthetase subunit TsaC/SUA5/YrdC
MTEPMHEPEAIRAQFEDQLDVIVDGGVCGGGATTVIDPRRGSSASRRYGRGDPVRLGLPPGPMRAIC